MPTIFRKKVLVQPTDSTTPPVAFNVDVPDINYTQPPDGVYMTLDLLDGWDKTSELNAILSDIGGFDGQIPADRFFAKSRHIVLAGAVEAPNEETAEQMEDFIVRAFPRDKDIQISKYTPTPKWVTARLENQIEIVYATPHSFRFSVPVVCPDPLKYGIDLITATAGVAGQSSGGFTFPLFMPLVFTSIDDGSSSVATVVNAGTGYTAPTITVYGPLDIGWFIENIDTAELLRFDIPLASSDQLVIYCRDQKAYLNGSTNLVNSSILGDFFRLGPGTSHLKLFGNFNALAGLRVEIHSAWE